MLLKGSVLIEVILILLSARSKGQEYDVEDAASYESEGDDHEHPDYSKYYSVDTGSSPETTGFVGSGEFFAPSQPIIFGASNKKSVTAPGLAFEQTRTVPQTFGYFPAESGLRDFFEEAQKKEQVANQQRVNEEFIAPGPSYISHSVPPLKVNYSDDKDEAESADDVERIPPRPNKPREEKEDDDAYYKPEYNLGGSGSSGNHYPSASGLNGDHLGPYRKYSFQPKSKDFILPSASSSDLKGCRRIDSPSNSDPDNMNCFICEDEANNSKYTQCSYKSKQAPEEYYTGNSERYSVPEKPPTGFRYKRYARKSHDPYDVVRERSRKALEESHVPEELRLDFQYEPESYDETNPDISYSERESEETKKNPENCKKVDKGGMTCTICHNPKSGGNYEQCSYTSEPSEKKYAYVTEKKYDSDDPEESKVSTKTEPVEDKPKESEDEPAKPKDIEGIEPYESQIAQDEEKTPRKREDDNEKYDEPKEDYDEAPKGQHKQKLVNDENYDVPSHFSENIKSEPSHHEDTRDEGDNSDFDEYHFRLFPELRKKDADDEEEEEGREYHTPEATKHNVEEVLAEFSKKDRSTCKKAEKNGMTCFLCVDANNIQHEECMYVQESRPQSKHVAYHEVKGVKDSPKESVPEESKVIEKPPQVAPTTTLVAAASEEVETVVPYSPKAKLSKRKRSPKKKANRAKAKSEEEPTLKTPTEFEVADEEGAFSAETRPVYSKLHGVKLPEYMLSKSGFEKEFDEFAGAF